MSLSFASLSLRRLLDAPSEVGVVATRSATTAQQEREKRNDEWKLAYTTALSRCDEYIARSRVYAESAEIKWRALKPDLLRTTEIDRVALARLVSRLDAAEARIRADIATYGLIVTQMHTLIADQQMNDPSDWLVAVKVAVLKAAEALVEKLDGVQNMADEQHVQLDATRRKIFPENFEFEQSFVRKRSVAAVSASDPAQCLV